jgi:hypothetical protein
MQMIIIKIGCRIGQSCKIRCDVLIHASVGEPSRSRDIPNNKVSRRLLGTAAKLGTIWSCMTEVGAQLVADMLLSRPLGSPCVAPILLPIGWSLVSSRVTPWLVVVAGVVGTLVATRTTLVTTKIWAVMRHSKMSRGLSC